MTVQRLKLNQRAIKTLSNETTVKSTNASKATSKSSAKSTTDATAETTIFKFLQEKFLQQLLAAKSSSKSSSKSSTESSKSTKAASETIQALVNNNFHSAQCSLLLSVNGLAINYYAQSDIVLALHAAVGNVDSMDIGRDFIIVVMVMKRLQSEVLQQLRY